MTSQKWLQLLQCVYKNGFARKYFFYLYSVKIKKHMGRAGVESRLFYFALDLTSHYTMAPPA